MRYIIFTVALFSALLLRAGVPTAEKVNRNYHNFPNYGQAQYFELRNDLNTYLVYFQWMKPTAKREGKVVVGIPEPVFWQGFVSRDFMNLVINGINSTQLEPKSIQTFRRTGCAGVEALYNFDGVRMILRFTIHEKSSLLQMEWEKASGSVETIRSAELHITTYPVYSVRNGGKKDPRYRRVILTPVQKLKVDRNTAWKKLTAADTSLVMYDEAFEPSATPKAQSPCFMAIDWKGILSGRVWFGQIYCMNFRFQLDPKAQKWRFGLWEYKKPMDSKEFLEFRKNRPEHFTLPAE